jgi:8-oxo-dGTP diphosphatase
MKPAANAIVTHQKRILLLLRGATAPWAPLKWALPGGYLERGETPIQGLLRELQEETGLTRPLFVQGPLNAGPHYVFRVSTPTSQIRLLDGEHDQYRWVLPRDTLRYDLAPYVAQILRKYQ